MNERQRYITQGELQMWHPLGPRPDAALLAFKKIEEDANHPLRSIKDFVGTNTAGERKHDFLRALGLRTIQALRDQGRPAESGWLSAFLEKTWPSLGEKRLRREDIGAVSQASPRQ